MQGRLKYELLFLIYIIFRSSGYGNILAYLQTRKKLKELCMEYIVKHRDLFNEEVEELPSSLKKKIKKCWTSDERFCIEL